MILTRLRFIACFLASILILPLSSNAFDTHLSDTAIRNAYFLGQHHDESVIQFLDKYTRYLPQPKTGPSIQQVIFLTPYALAVQQSAGYASGYSAHTAQLYHPKHPEIVRVIVHTTLTDSYGPYLVTPAKPRTTATQGIALRSPDFWRDFRFRLYNNGNFVIPSTASGQPTYSCSDDSGCILSGATLTYEYPADSFSGDSASIQIDPPEADPILLDFDLAALK